MKIGDIVYLVPIGNNARYIKDDILNHVEEKVVEKVGKKYFYLEGMTRERFDIEKMVVDGGGYSPWWKVYTDLQEFKDSNERSELIVFCRKHFDYMFKVNLTLAQLRKIKEIIQCQESTQA